MAVKGRGERWTDALILLLTVLFAAWVLLPGWRIDNDSCHHSSAPAWKIFHLEPEGVK